MKEFAAPITPDVSELIDIVTRRKPPRRVHPIELFLDEEIRNAVADRFGLGAKPDPQDTAAVLSRDIRVHAFLGYDMFRVRGAPKDLFPMRHLPAEDTTAERRQSRGDRQWQEEHQGPIQSWADFESYPWPKLSDVDLTQHEWLEKHLPDGMAFYDLSSHIFELQSFLLGYESLCYLVVDDPALADAVLQRVGEFTVAYTETLADCTRVGVIWGSDDLGFRTGTMMSPAYLRAKILPWHTRCAEIAHRHGKPYLLHSCGNLDQIAEDLIETVRIDAKHSYEDTILPAVEAKKRYGNRMAILGGIDMDFLCRSNEEQVRRRTRETLEQCMPGGGYCLGTGNTVANYLPLDNYLGMLDEGRRWKV